MTRDIDSSKVADHDDGRLSKGETSRTAILQAAAKLATTKGLIGLSIGDLAAEVGMSKSGLYAHFKSKEELELATIATAAEIFEREVLRPALATPEGCQRLRALVVSFLGHLERRVFPGGCFFAAVAMELDTQPGAARDRVVQVQQRWMSLLAECLQYAKQNKEIRSDSDIAQAVFEIQAMLLAANFLFVLSNNPAVLAQGRKGAENVLARLKTQPEMNKKRLKRFKS
jgi:AcrR family transcriptional regulator